MIREARRWRQTENVVWAPAALGTGLPRAWNCQPSKRVDRYLKHATLEAARLVEAERLRRSRGR